MSNLKLYISQNILAIGGLILLFISLMIIWGNLTDYNIIKKGFEVTANVIEAPSDCKNVSSRGGFCKLEYKNKIYVVKAGKKFCHLVSQQKNVEMLTNQDGSKLLFHDEFNDFEFASGFIVFALAMFFILKNFFLKSNR